MRFRALAVTAALFVAAPAHAAWPHDPTAALQVAPSSFQPEVETDGAGGTIVAYSMGSEIRAQRFDGDGAPLWGPGVVVCSALGGSRGTIGIAVHPWGGVVVLWNDTRTVPGQYDLYAQRIGVDGVAQWTPNGVPVCVGGSTTNFPQLAVDEYGGSCIVWEDSRDIATAGMELYYQYIYASGVVFGPATGMPLATGPGWQTGPTVATSDYATFVAWSDGSAAGGADIRMQRVDFGGLSWGPVGILVCGSPNTQDSPAIARWGGDRLSVAWRDFASYQGQIRMQSVSIYGYTEWAPAGIEVAPGAWEQGLPQVMGDSEGGAVVVWRDHRAGAVDLFAQRLLPSGSPQWAPAGAPVRVGASDAVGHRLVRSDAGSIVVAWQDRRADAGDIHAQKLSVGGSPLWRTGGVVVQKAAGAQMPPRIVAMSDGGAWLVWDDFRPTGFTVRHQRVDRWGYLGAAPVMAGVGDVAGDQGGQVRVAWYASGLDTDPAFSVVSDYFVFRSVPAPLAARLAREESALRGGDGALTTRDGRRFRRLEVAAAASYFWEEVARVAPRRLGGYSVLAATEADSTAAGNPPTAFLVMAQGNDGSYWMSAPDSGYSVDNLAPAAPTAFAGLFSAGTMQLSWSANREPDLAGYRLYRGTDALFVPGPASLLSAVSDTLASDPAGTPYFYKLEAVDLAGNRSPAVLLSPGGVLDAPGAEPARLALAAPMPHPWTPGRTLTLRYTLPRTGAVRLALYDASGREVRMLAEGERPAGAHTLQLADAGALRPGLYLLTLEAAGTRRTQRLVVTR